MKKPEVIVRAPPRGLPAGGLHSLTGSSVGSESVPHFNISPCGRGFELSRRRKKRAIGTCHYSPVSEWSTPAGRPQGGALTIILKWGALSLPTDSVGSESALHFNMSLWSWVRALTEAKEKGMGHAPMACEWDHPSSEWARGWGPYS